MNAYVKIARPDHWFKNIFVLPGCLIAALFSDAEISSFFFRFVVGMVATCLIASANYVINEWLDREPDRFHPVKKNRPSVAAEVSLRGVVIEYVLLLSTGFALSYAVSLSFLWVMLWLAVMGVIYNVKPLRSKDRAYLDVLSESINNPIRLLLGWFIVTDSVLPPSSLLISYWMGGAFLMSVKRFSEYRFIADPVLAGNYRRSFQFYTQDSLLCSVLLYAMVSAFFASVFIVKHKIELILTVPFYALMFAWYLRIGFKPDSMAQHPEKMHQEKAFLAFVLFVAAITVFCLMVKLPFLDWLLT